MVKPELPPPALLDPGWYPDPTGRYEARFWDGRGWTGNISHYGATGTDPLRRSRWESRLRPLWLFQLFGLLIIAGAIAAAAWYFWPDGGPDVENASLDPGDAVVMLEDLPSGWSEVETGIALSPIDAITNGDTAVEPTESTTDGADGSDGSDTADSAGATDQEEDPCGHFSSVDASDQASASSHFESGDLLSQITDRVTVLNTTSAAEDLMDKYRSDETGACLLRLLDLAVLSDGATLGDPQVSLQDPPAFGDEAVWWRIEGTSTGFVAVGWHADVVVLRDDQVVAEFTFLGQLERIGVAVQRDSLRPVAQKIADGLADPPDDPATDPDDDSADGSGEDE